MWLNFLADDSGCNVGLVTVYFSNSKGCDVKMDFTSLGPADYVSDQTFYDWMIPL